ncbi:hypothetical protein P167DRAFT_107971 [Morchella conica CCBAS932]|uniref:Uncharacterized protein n=1 Tax=Morchella conica CCBAS932 TaxID=1392247 RepID=A0A3N4K7M2_9PEZI|nr:hypothetical protein P167DRAFT_107971 [Morchella conica CCBAS932]
MGSQVSRVEDLTPHLTTFNLLISLPLLGTLYLVTEAIYNLFLNPNKQYLGPLLAALTKVTPSPLHIHLAQNPPISPALHRHPLAHRPLPHAHTRPTPALRPRSPHRPRRALLRSRKIYAQITGA